MLNIFDPRKNVLINRQGANGQINLLKFTKISRELETIYITVFLIPLHFSFYFNPLIKRGVKLFSSRGFQNNFTRSTSCCNDLS